MILRIFKQRKTLPTERLPLIMIKLITRNAMMIGRIILPEKMVTQMVRFLLVMIVVLERIDQCYAVMILNNQIIIIRIMRLVVISMTVGPKVRLLYTKTIQFLLLKSFVMQKQMLIYQEKSKLRLQILT